MADIPEVVTTDPHEMLSVGRRHLAVRDYSSAVGCLGQACEMLAQKYGQHADECGEAYLWYGKSLLGLAREESGVLGDGIPQGAGDESQDDKDEDQDAVDEDNNEEPEEEDETKPDKGDAKDEEMEVEKVDKEVQAESKDKKIEPKEEIKESGDVKKEEIKTDKEDAKDEKMEVEKVEKEEPKEEKKELVDDVNKEDTSVKKEDDLEAAAADKEKVFSAKPSTSEDKETKEGSDSEDEDEVENLQVAWEVLELARDVFLKRGERGRQELADVYLHLGEVSLESETYDKAVSDMSKSLDLFKELYSADDRRIAETHYQIGLAHSLSNGFEEAISHFKTAAEILQARIKNLEAPSAADDANVKKYLASDPFYSIAGEVKELKELLPEIQEKIQDMQDYKAEHVRSICESLLATANGTSNGQASNGQSSSSKTNGSSSSSAPIAKVEEKKASDISHLVRRKRKPSEEAVVEGVSVATKKPAQ